MLGPVGASMTLGLSLNGLGGGEGRISQWTLQGLDGSSVTLGISPNGSEARQEVRTLPLRRSAPP